MKKAIAIILILTVTFAYAKEKKTKIIFMGDSITDGNWGGGGGRPSDQRNKTDYNHIYGHGFMEMITGYYMSEFPEKEYEFQNRGISGYTLYNLQNKWEKDVIEEKPDVLSILVGTNDVLFHLRKSDKSSDFNFQKWDSTYRVLLDDARRANPNVRIILCSPFVVKTGDVGANSNWETRKDIIEKLGSIVKKIAEDYNATYIPFDHLFLELGAKYQVPDNYWSWDGVHPTTQAHYKMAKMWIKKVGKL